MFRTIDRYETTDLGLPYTVAILDGAEEEISDATGERVGVSIMDMEGLVAALAVGRALCPLQLDGAEVRFLRRALGKTGKAFAEAIALDPATYSRWETGKQSVGEWADKQVRLAVVVLLADRVGAPGLDPKSVVELRIRPRQDRDTIRVEVRRTADAAWSPELAA